MLDEVVMPSKENNYTIKFYGYGVDNSVLVLRDRRADKTYTDASGQILSPIIAAIYFSGSQYDTYEFRVVMPNNIPLSTGQSSNSRDLFGEGNIYRPLIVNNLLGGYPALVPNGIVPPNHNRLLGLPHILNHPDPTNLILPTE